MNPNPLTVNYPSSTSTIFSMIWSSWRLTSSRLLFYFLVSLLRSHILGVTDLCQSPLFLSQLELYACPPRKSFLTLFQKQPQGTVKAF